MSRLVPIIAGSSLWIGSHLALSHDPIRSNIIDKVGKQKFLGLYSFVSAVTLFPTVFYYARYARGSGSRLFTPSIYSKSSGYAFKVAGLLTLSQSFFSSSLIKADENDSKSEFKVDGIHRVTRHSLFLSFALLGCGNMLLLPALADVCFWAMFPTMWVVGSLHQDERLKRTLPKEFFLQTSFLPFGAVIEGRQRMSDIVKEFQPKPFMLALLALLF